MDYNNEKDVERIMAMTGRESAMTSAEYQKQISDLYKEWKSRVDTNDTPFVTDGVIDPEQWFKQDERIMFVIKEAHSDKGEKDWDLSDHALLNGKFGKRVTWRNISLWAKEMQNIYGDYNPNDKDLETFGNKYLHSIAALNIKKYNGTITSNDEDIIHYAFDIYNIPYLAFNFPIDECEDCGYTGDIANEWGPACMSKKILRLRRITGYLNRDVKTFNVGKQNEVFLCFLCSSHANNCFTP